MKSNESWCSLTITYSGFFNGFGDRCRPGRGGSRAGAVSCFPSFAGNAGVGLGPALASVQPFPLVLMLRCVGASPAGLIATTCLLRCADGERGHECDGRVVLFRSCWTGEASFRIGQQGRRPHSATSFQVICEGFGTAGVFRNSSANSIHEQNTGTRSRFSKRWCWYGDAFRVRCDTRICDRRSCRRRERRAGQRRGTGPCPANPW